MKIAIGADHGGYLLKGYIVSYLKKNGHAVEDFGTYTKESCDYPKIAREVGGAVASGKFERGILICKTGLGMSVAANKIPGIRACLIENLKNARSSREHNKANIAVFSGDRLSPKASDRLIDVWLKTEFAGGRHARRISQIEDIERDITCGKKGGAPKETE